jgi:hypothetical protein
MDHILLHVKFEIWLHILVLRIRATRNKNEALETDPFRKLTNISNSAIFENGGKSATFFLDHDLLVNEIDSPTFNFA